MWWYQYDVKKLLRISIKLNVGIIGAFIADVKGFER